MDANTELREHAENLYDHKSAVNYIYQLIPNVITAAPSPLSDILAQIMHRRGLDPTHIEHVPGALRCRVYGHEIPVGLLDNVLHFASAVAHLQDDRPLPHLREWLEGQL